MGAEITDAYGPLHSITTAAGTTTARSHTNYQYGLDTPATYGTYASGAFTLGPSGLPWQLVTQTVSGYSTTADPTTLSASAMTTDFGSTSLPDYRTTTNSYTSPGSGYGSPLAFDTPSSVAVTVNGSTTITSRTALNLVGQTAYSLQPMSSGNDQGTRTDVYYSASGSGTCNANTAWAGLLCQTAPGATAPAVGSPVPTTTTTYNGNLEPQTVTQVVSGTTERTTTNAYDLSGRATATSVTDASGLSDVAVNDVEPVYSSTSGLQTATDYVTGDSIANGTLTAPGTVTSSLTTGYDANGRVQSYTDAKGATTNYTYNVDSLVVQTAEPVTGVTGGMSVCNTYGGTDSLGNTEDRPVVTSESVVIGTSCAGSNPATYTASYDANGNNVSLKYPNTMVATTTYDLANQPTILNYTQGGSGVGSGYGSTLMSFAQSYNVFGEVSSASSPESSQAYAYDGAGRLTGVGDNFEGSCTTRTYALDADSNRTSFTSAATTPTGGVCPTTNTAGATSTSTFDTTASGQGGSDRIISSTWGSNTGTYAYDALGRQTTVPSVDTGTGGSTTPGNVALTYRADDMVNSMSQGSACMNYTYDPSSAVVTTSNYASSSCTGTATSTATNYYSGGGSPAWTVNTVGSATSTTSYFDGITQGNALNVLTGPTATTSCLGSSTASCTLNLTDMRGDIIATAIITSGTATVSGYSEQTEFGQARSQSVQNTVAPLYGWLGTHQKAENNLSALVLMGARVYNPTTALFSESDPVYQGNANPYTYPSDPVNQFDLSGMKGGDTLSQDEQDVWDMSTNGRTISGTDNLLSPAQQKIWKQARQKIVNQGKYARQRNKQKDRGQVNKFSGASSTATSPNVWDLVGVGLLGIVAAAGCATGQPEICVPAAGGATALASG
jgi:RHS repeat-associated protein